MLYFVTILLYNIVWRRIRVEAYLDNSATTKLSDHAVSEMTRVMKDVYGNPSSLHGLGKTAEEELSKARRTIADTLGAADSEIIFTSGGTEANNLAVLGGARARKRRGNKIVTTAIEHSSVFESVKALENEGFETVFIKPDESGHITEDAISEAIDENTILVSVMYVNNETGVIMPADRIARIIKKKNAPALFHIDAVQAYGKLPIKVQKLGCDMLTVSAHKIHGPKGCGALFIKKGVHIVPLVYGGEQERRLRPGTEAVAQIVGFAAAAQELGDLNAKLDTVRKLRDYTLGGLLGIGGVIRNSPEDALPYIINISTNAIKSETMLHALESDGVYISSGSACAKGKPSHVLTALGFDRLRADTALRISFSAESTKEEADRLIEGVRTGVETLVKIR